jgi:hypothetical protein
VEADDTAFFHRSGDLRPGFFAALVERFTHVILPQSAPVFEQQTQSLLDRFDQVWVIDGSRLASIWRRLRVLWKVRHVVLPGAMLVLYDLHRGIIRHVDYSVDAARAELTRAMELVVQVPAGALLVADRLFAVPKFVDTLNRLHIWLLAKRNKRVKLRAVIQRFADVIYHESVLKDELVQVGGHNGTPKQIWRRIRVCHKGRTVHDLITTVLDPAVLSAVEAIELYPRRWTIERMFFDLKEVLNLNQIYCAQPYAVAQQVYASVLVYNALRVGQGLVAQQIEIEPEALSVPKLFPRMAAVSAQYVYMQLGIQSVVELNPKLDLVLPDLRRRGIGTVPLATILVDKRKPNQRKRRYCKARGEWKSFAHIPGTKQFAKN